MPVILSHFLDALRWIGALIVLGVHSTNMFVSLSDIMTAPHNPAVYAWWFFISYELGHHAVVGFFVMSGYLVGGAVLTGLRKQRDFLREYLIHRVARIYMVIGPAILFTLVFDVAGRALFKSSGVYDWPMFDGHFSILTYLGGLLSLQSIWIDYPGTNGPLWSLACEFWYYVTFPLILLPLGKNYPASWRWGGFALGLTLICVLAYPPSWFTFGYILWAIGALASQAERPIMRSRFWAAVLLVVVLIPLRLLIRGSLLEAHPWLQNVADATGALLFLNLILAIRFSPSPEWNRGWAIFRPKWHVRLANFSFSLYCIHMPTLILLRSATGSVMGVEWPKMLATPAHWTLMFVVMAGIIGLAWLFAQFTEAKTGAARRWLHARLPQFGAPTAKVLEPQE